MKYKSGDTLLFQHNSLNAEFYRDFLAEEFRIHRYEWESCGYPQEFPPGKNSIHLPFYQTNTFAVLSIVRSVHHRRSWYTAACGTLSEIL